MHTIISKNGQWLHLVITERLLLLSFQYSYAECLGHHQEGTVGQDCWGDEQRAGGRARGRGPWQRKHR